MPTTLKPELGHMSRSNSTESLLDAVFNNLRNVSNQLTEEELRAGSITASNGFSCGNQVAESRKSVWPTSETISNVSNNSLNDSFNCGFWSSENGSAFNRDALGAAKLNESGSSAASSSSVHFSSRDIPTSSASGQARLFANQRAAPLACSQPTATRSDAHLPNAFPFRTAEEQLPMFAPTPTPINYANYLQSQFRAPPINSQSLLAPPQAFVESVQAAHVYNNKNNLPSHRNPINSIASARGVTSDVSLSFSTSNRNTIDQLRQQQQQNEISREQLSANLRMLKAKELSNAAGHNQALSRSNAGISRLPNPDRHALPRSVQNGVYVINGVVVNREQLAAILNNAEIERTMRAPSRDVPQLSADDDTEATRKALGSMLLNSAAISGANGRAVLGGQLGGVASVSEVPPAIQSQIRMLANRLLAQLDANASTSAGSNVHMAQPLAPNGMLPSLPMKHAFDVASTSSFGIANAQMHARANPRSKGSHTQISCKFCENNGEPFELYSTHTVKDGNGSVTCPVLRAYECPLCKATGERAHTLKYCPLSTGGDHVDTHKLLKVGRNAAGKKRRNSNSTTK